MFKYRVLGYENANVQAYDFALKMETERISEMQVVYPLSIGNTELHWYGTSLWPAETGCACNT